MDAEGNITRIIECEFAYTLPVRAAEHYPDILMDEKKFVESFEDVYEDPLTQNYVNGGNFMQNSLNVIR